ncbi:MAG TPA: ribonuclease E/G [Caulobacteraceae bacterium]
MSTRSFFIDRAIGETRGVVTFDGRPERLLIARDGEDAAVAIGARSIARVKSVNRSLATAFLELPGGAPAVLGLKPDMERITEGQAVEVEIRSEPRRGKSAAARLIGPGEGAPRLLAPGADIETELRALARDGKLVEGLGAREAADEAEAEALETIHPLPGGGSLAIEETRALVAIDVDVGERAGADSKRVTRQTNLTALYAAARLLRLKGLGGLVVVDLAGRGHDAAALLSAARVAFGPDNPGVAISPVSRFGTMELTIPRRRRPIVDLLREDSCRSAALRLIRMLEREGRASPGARLTAACAPEVASAAHIYESALADRLGRRFIIVAREGWGPERLEVSAQ